MERASAGSLKSGIGIASLATNLFKFQMENHKKEVAAWEGMVAPRRT
jgi:hypothetical protein